MSRRIIFFLEGPDGFQVPPEEWFQQMVQPRKRRNRIQASHIHLLPWAKPDLTKTCCICLEEFQAKSRVKRLPCQHEYHFRCLLAYFRDKEGFQVKCPMCRKNFETPASLTPGLNDGITR